MSKILSITESVKLVKEIDSMPISHLDFDAKAEELMKKYGLDEYGFAMAVKVWSMPVKADTSRSVAHRIAEMYVSDTTLSPSKVREKIREKYGIDANVGYVARELRKLRAESRGFVHVAGPNFDRRKTDAYERRYYLIILAALVLAALLTLKVYVG